MFAPPAAGPQPADAALVDQVAAGSQVALSVLYDRHAGTVHRVALSVTRDRQVAEEVVQETFLALWNRAELFDPALGDLDGWLATIARNRSRDRQRAARRRIPADAFSSLLGDGPETGSMLDWLVAAGRPLAAGAMDGTPEALALEHEAAAHLGRLVASLPALEREVLVLAYRDGLTQSEVALRLGWPIGTVKTRTRRALARLRLAIGEAEDDADDEAPEGGAPKPAAVRTA